jgi:hypothetical protein
VYIVNQCTPMDDLFRSFIEVGEAGVPKVVPEVAWNGAHTSLMGDPSYWRNALEGLSREDHEGLIRGIVLHVAAGGFDAGSVSPAVLLCRTYAALYPSHELEMLRWVVQHSRNPCVPYGRTWTGPVVTYRELDIHDASEAENERARAAQEAIRLKAVLQARLHDAVLRRDLPAVKALLRRGGRLGIHEDAPQLAALAIARGRPDIAEILVATQPRGT